MRFTVPAVLLISGSSLLFAQEDPELAAVLEPGPDAAALATATPAPPWAPITGSENYRYSFNRVFSPGKLALFAAKAGFDQERDFHARWGQGSQAYAERYLDHFGRALLREHVAFGIRSLDGEDPRYQPSHESGAWKRSRHAIAASFATRGRNGQLMPAYSRFISDYATPFIAQQWEPERFSAGRAMRNGTAGIGFAVASNLGLEFWPDIKHRFLHR